MDKQLTEALNKVVKKRVKLLDQNIDDATVNALVLKLGDQLSQKMNHNLQNELASCGSFQCPSSYACDWF